MFIGHIGLEDRKASGIIENTIEIVKFSLNPARFSDDFPMFFSSDSGLWSSFFYI